MPRAETSSAKTKKIKTQKIHALQWIADSMSHLPEFATSRMFGCLAVHVRGSLVLVLADKAEPWKGVLVCTDRSHHTMLQKKIKGLVPHSILGKWLYLSMDAKNFESVVEKIISIIGSNNTCIGV